MQGLVMRTPSPSAPNASTARFPVSCAESSRRFSCPRDGRPTFVSD